MLLSSSQYLGHLLTTEIVVWGACIGAIIAFSINFFQNHILGSFVRKLLKECVGEESAKTLTELGCDRFYYRFFLKNGSSLRKFVGGCVDNSQNEAKIAPVRYYIIEEKSEYAAKRYSKDAPIWLYIVSIVSSVAVATAMHFLLPLMLNLI